MTAGEETHEAPRRASLALGSVQILTLEDLKEIDTSQMAPIRVLVTVHSIKPLLGNIYVKGLGMWVGYIIQKYLKMRKIPHRFYMKSILTTGGCRTTRPETVMKFIKRNKIDVLIPSDVTDTMFVAKHYDKIGPIVKVAVTPDLEVYETLEDKWDTFNLCKSHGIATPQTELFDPKKEKQDYPFFLKVASGTNAGRGVWHCKNDDDLVAALKSKEANGMGVLLLAQKPTYGEIICAEIIYQKGKPVGFFFAKSVQVCIMRLRRAEFEHVFRLTSFSINILANVFVCLRLTILPEWGEDMYSPKQRNTSNCTATKRLNWTINSGRL